MDNELLAHLEGMESRLREHVTVKIGDIEAKVIASGTRLEARIADNEARLEGWIAASEVHLEGRIADTAVHLEGRIAESEARLEDHVRERIAETEGRLREHTEIVETRLLGAFWKWARISEIKGRVGEANVLGLGERMSALEDRLSDLEKGRAS